MSRPEAKGWCPDAHRPMMSGDGLLVRIHPRLGRLSAEQVFALCDAADTHGSGLIDLTSRANIQIRGVREESYQQLLPELAAVGVIELDETNAYRHNIIVSPLWRHGDDTWRIATELMTRLREFPDLPAKFGLAIDAGETPLLSAASADIRVERADSGDLIVRADNASRGQMTTMDAAADNILALAHWFVDTGGAGSKRMAQHITNVPLPDHYELATPLKAAAELVPGPSPIGPVYGAAFGSLNARTLSQIVKQSGAIALRTTPWRRFILEAGKQVESDEFITNPSDPIQLIDACPGAPFCASALVETRTLARQLGDAGAGEVHVSGCAKGCAHPSSSPTTIVGRDGKFDVVFNGNAWDAPAITGMDTAQVAARLGLR